jgi:hypothetical protein
MQLRRLDHSSVYLFEGTSPANVHLFDQVPLEWTWLTTVEGAVQLIEDALKNKKTLYLRPISDTFAAVDAIMVCGGKVLLLQLTISSKQAQLRRPGCRQGPDCAGGCMCA